MADDFKPGDVVMLKSEGPKMTYERRAQEGYGWCLWFEGNTKKTDTFPHAALKKVDDDPKRQSIGIMAI